MNNKTEIQWPNHEVIEVKNTLGQKALVPGDPKQAIALATQKADAAMQQLSEKFPAWMQSESNLLHDIRNEIATRGLTPQRLDRLFTCSHDIKGQAPILGYPIAGIIGQLLCDLIEHAPNKHTIPLNVIDQHVDTIRAIVRQDLKGMGNKQTNNIIQGLKILDKATLQKMAKKAPVAQAV